MIDINQEKEIKHWLDILSIWSFMTIKLFIWSSLKGKEVFIKKTAKIKPTRGLCEWKLRSKRNKQSYDNSKVFMKWKM